PAIARAAGIEITWDDFAEISAVTPLLARIYPNGSADVNHFHAAGGMAFLTRELLGAGLLHGDAQTVWAGGMAAYTQAPALENDALLWRDAPAESSEKDVLRGAAAPFSADGGLRLMCGGLGRAVAKVSAVAADKRLVQAPARVFDSQADVQRAFKNG